jgi:hypothetical protein
MKGILYILLAALALGWTSCMVWIDDPASTHHSDDAWVAIESNTDWLAEIDGRELSGSGDCTLYTDTDCAIVYKESCCGYVQLTVKHAWEKPVVSYTNAEYGEVWICDEQYGSGEKGSAKVSVKTPTETNQ